MGSGLGKVLMAAALMFPEFRSIIGMEFNAQRVALAHNAKMRIHQDMPLICGDDGSV